MTTMYFTGKAAAVAQVSRVQVGAYDAATTYKLSVNGVSVSTSGAGSVEATATALAAAWNASTHPYFTPITASVDADVSPNADVVLTADEGGFPFTAAASVTGGSGSIGSVSNDTEPTGPNHWDNADNWSAGVVPGDGDTAYVTLESARIAWGIDRSGVSPDETIADLIITGAPRVGLSFAGVATSADGDTIDASAPEYRDQYLKASITAVSIEENNSANLSGGTGRCFIHNTATAASTTTVKQTAQSAADTTRPAVCLLFDSANADLFVTGARGAVGVAVGNPGEATTVGDIFIDDDTAVSDVKVGAGVTMSSFRIYGGFASIASAATMPSIVAFGGETTVNGNQAVTTMTVNPSASVISNTTGTIGTLNQELGSLVDFLQSGKARTVTTYNYNGGERRLDAAVLTITTDNRSGRIRETIESA